MPSAVTAIFGANSTQFQAELAKMQTMAMASASRIKSATSAGGHGAVGMTGMVRETTVIGREIAMGRGMGRILGSLTLLTQYIGSASRAAKAGSNAAAELAAAYEKQALKAQMAAIAAAKKAAALGVEAEMEGFEIDATLAAADAAGAEAATAQAAAVALREKAAAAATDAAAQEANAAATAGAGMGIMGMISVFALMVVIIAEAYVVFKSLVAILSRVSNAQLEAAKWAHEHKLAIYEEIEAMEKLKDATQKTQEAIERMNIEKDHSVEVTRQAIEAAKAEAEARSNLYDLQEKGRMLELGIQKSIGAVSSLEYINRKAEIEKKSIAEKSAAKQDELDKEAQIADMSAQNARAAAEEAQENAQSASDKINASPEGKQRALALAAAEKDLEASKKEAEEAAKQKIEFNEGGSNILGSSSIKAWMEGYGTGHKGVRAFVDRIMTGGISDISSISGALKNKSAALAETEQSKMNAAASAEIRVNALKRMMSPDEKAASNALRVAQEKTEAAQSLFVSADQSANAANTYRKYAGSQVSEAQRNVEMERTQAILESLSAGKGYGLNSQQKAGAYAATPPEFRQMVNYLQAIAVQTRYLIPPSALAPGTRPPQMGTRPPAIQTH